MMIEENEEYLDPCKDISHEQCKIDLGQTHS